MSATLQLRSLHLSSLTAIEEVRCRPCGTTRSEEETVAWPNLVFVHSGLFVKHVGRRRVQVDPNHVVFFRPGSDYRVSHPGAVGDDCASFAFAPALARETLGWPTDEAPISALVHPGVTGLQWSIRHLAASAGADPLELDERCVQLLRSVARMSASETRTRRSAVFCGWVPASPTEAAHRRLADRTRELLATRFAEAWSLGRIASFVGCSPFHLSRVFRRQAGLPLHRYLLRLRMKAALEKLVETGDSLAALAHELGFSSHAHFSATFAREYGVAPSVVRERPDALVLSSKILKA